MYREELGNNYNMDRDGFPVKSRSEKIQEARRAFSDGSSEEYLATNEKKHPFGLIRLMAAGMLFLILMKPNKSWRS